MNFGIVVRSSRWSNWKIGIDWSIKITHSIDTFLREIFNTNLMSANESFRNLEFKFHLESSVSFHLAFGETVAQELIDTETHSQSWSFDFPFEFVFFFIIKWISWLYTKRPSFCGFMANIRIKYQIYAANIDYLAWMIPLRLELCSNICGIHSKSMHFKFISPINTEQPLSLRESNIRNSGIKVYHRLTFQLCVYIPRIDLF